MIIDSYQILRFNLKRMRCRIVFLFFIISILSYPASVFAQTILKEDKIKASYIFNFIRFIQWPEQRLGNNTSPLNVCVINRSDRFIKAFKPVVGKKVNGHPLTLHKVSDADELSQCHVVYIDKSKQKKIKELINFFDDNKILSISDIETFCKDGGMIGMVNIKGKIKVEINLDAARRAGFHISSNLLEVAKIVTSQ